MRAVNAGTDGTGTIVFSRCGNPTTLPIEIFMRCRAESETALIF